MKELADIAKFYVDEMNALHDKLQNEKNDLVTKLNEINRRINQSKQAAPRFSSYDTKSAFCPKCFICEGSSFEIKPIPSNDSLDRFICKHCNSEYEIKS